MDLREYVPPILLTLRKRLKQYQPLYESYESALSVCKGGYEEDDLIKVVFEKTKLYRDRFIYQNPFIAETATLNTLTGLSLAIRDKELNIIDIGGACGTHYFLAKMAFGNRIKLRWHVVETSAMVSKAIALEDDSLHFFDDLQKAKSGMERIDLVFSSNALQFLPRPYEFLERLVGCRAENIYLTRLGLSTLEKELITIQRSRLSANGPGPMPQGIKDKISKYPATFVKKGKVEAILNKDYSINILFNEDKGAFQAAQHSIDMFGYFCEFKK